jgi:HK97 family phage prohead protease/HK97 family phage major capsid protein
MEARMPMKPHKGESQDDFMKRCVPDLMGDGKREQDQAVAACLTIWRDDKGQKQPEGKEFADPGYRGDGRKRYVIDTADQVRTAWHNIHRVGETYTKAQDDRIKARIISAWKVLIDKAGPPDLGDASNRAALRQHVMTVSKQNVPEVDEDESHDDYIERCMSELDDMADDDAEEACQLAWEEANDGERGGEAVVLHKTLATPSSGMEFILSDATPDRFGDVIDPRGWNIEAFSNNPIALFNHNSNFVIGRWKNLRKTDKDLRGDLELAPKGTSDRIDEIRKLIEADILRAVSVGFRPIEHAPINAKDPWGGTHYTAHELVETSVVAVPANPNALAVAKSLGVSGNTLRMVFGEHADKGTIVQREYRAQRGEHADTPKRETTTKQTGEHADPQQTGAQRRTPMLLSQRIQEAEKGLLAMQDQLDGHLETIDDDNPTEEQMALTEDLTAKIENKQRNLQNLKNIEAKNGNGAVDTGTATAVARRKSNEIRLPAELAPRPTRKADALDYIVRAAIVRAKSKVEGVSIDDMRRKIYGDDEATRWMTDLVLKAATAPAETTVTGWAAELVRTVWAAWMDVLLPVSVLPRLSAIGMGLTFGQNGRIVIPTRSLTPSIAGSFVGEGQPIPVRQGAFTSQTLTPKKLAVITSWTKEMEDFSIPAIEGLLRQAIIEDTAMSLDAVLLDNNVATVIRPPGLRSYGAGLTPSADPSGFVNFVADYSALYGALLTATRGNVRRAVVLLNPEETLRLSMVQPPGAAAPLFPFMTMLENNRLIRADVVESATVPAGTVIMLDAADFTTAGAEGPRMDISDTATLHMEDTAPADIVSGPSGTPVPATPVKSMWQTDSLALRMIMRLNWLMRRPVVAWMTGVAW